MCIRDSRQTTDRWQTDRRQHIANVNVSSRSLKIDVCAKLYSSLWTEDSHLVLTSLRCGVDGSPPEIRIPESRVAAWTFFDLWTSALSCSSGITSRVINLPCFSLIASLKDFSWQNKPVFCRSDLLSSSYDSTITNVYQQYFKITFWATLVSYSHSYSPCMSAPRFVASCTEC